MQIPIIGYVCIAAGMGCFLFYPKGLYVCTIFSLPFSATAIVNIGGDDSARGIQAWLFFAALWMFREFFRLSPNARPKTWRLLRRPRMQLFAFATVAIFSLIVPLTAAGSIWIESAELMSNGAAPLSLTSEQITQVAYLLFGIIFVFFIAVKNSEAGQLARTIKLFATSVLFTAVWGLLQSLCFTSGLQYPSYIFNTSATESAKGYLENFQGLGLTRISSVATEPSTFAQCTIIALALITVALLFRGAVISPKRDKMAVVLMLSALILSTASTAYVGILTLAVLLTVVLAHCGRLSKKYIVASLIVPVALVIAIVSVPILREIAQSQLLGKFETFSGLERVNSVFLAANYFLTSPILGLGWGSVTSHDLIFKLLSNVGLIGFVVFFVFILSMVRRLHRIAWPRCATARVSDQTYWCLQGLIAVILAIFLSLINGFPLVFGDFWFVLGFGLAAPLVGIGTARTASLKQASHPVP